MCGRYSALTEDEIIQVRQIIKDLSIKLAGDEFLNHQHVYQDAAYGNIPPGGVFPGGVPLENAPPGGVPPEGVLPDEIPLREVFPTNHAPVVASNCDELVFENARFGFEKWDGKGVIINARAETVKEKSMFKRHVGKGRCVIPTSGYFEWKAPDEGRKKKIKHLIKDKQGNLLFIAGLWREGPEGKDFVVITKEPYGDIVSIHNRMPVILRTDQLEQWLSGEMPIEALALLEYECIGTPCEAPVPEKDESNEQISLF